MMVHEAQLICVCRSCCRAGSAVATMVWSIDAISIPTETMAKITRRCGLGSSGMARFVAAVLRLLGRRTIDCHIEQVTLLAGKQLLW